jgi:zinc transporter ZupT
MGVYSIVEPIGITVGWMASENELIDATILAFASGAFLYIIGTEDLNDLFEMGGNSKSIKLLHYIVFSIGILLTILIWCADFELNN